MYCPECFQNTLKVKSSGVIKLAFNGKSKASSIFTYNLQKETQEQLIAKLRGKIREFFIFYSEFQNKSPLKNFEAFSSDFMCTNACKIDYVNTKVSMIGVIFTQQEIMTILKEEAQKYGLTVEVNLKH